MIRMWRLLALPFFLGLLFLAAYLYYYLGGYKPVVVNLVDQPELQTVYRPHRGAYHQINTVISEVETWAKAHQIPCSKTFGEYLNNPQQVEQSRLKSNGGCILEAALQIQDLPEHFIKGTIPAGRYVHATFAGSPAIGPWKVYPKLSDFMAEKTLQTSTTSIEVYTIEDDGKMTTDYFLPVIK